MLKRASLKQAGSLLVSLCSINFFSVLLQLFFVTVNKVAWANLFPNRLIHRVIMAGRIVNYQFLLLLNLWIRCRNSGQQGFGIRMQRMMEQFLSLRKLHNSTFADNRNSVGNKTHH